MTFRLFLALISVAAMGCAMGCGGAGATPADAAPAADARPPDAALPPAIGQFPPGFQWGTATAAYQVEGGLHATDWYQWESICQNCTPGESADDGPDFWNRWDEDLRLAAEMGTNSVRIGIEWARVFPTRASFPAAPDAAALARYHQIVAAARAHGLRVMITLHHFSTPTWLSDLTRPTELAGWEDEETADLFAEWAAFCARDFGADVDWWVTINEPMGYVAAGWLGGVWPPGKVGEVQTGLQVADNLIRGHALAYDAIHGADTVDADGDGKAAWVSFATHNRVFVPRVAGDPTLVAAADALRLVNNRMFLDAVVRGDTDANFDGDLDDPGDVRGDPSLAGRLDYVALQYYGVSVVIGNTSATFPFALAFQNDIGRFGIPNAVTDFGTVVYPEGFRVVLDEVSPYGLPIVVTENGIADADDDQRPRFIIDHLYALGKAIDDGIDVRGYYHWSLLDNFEWASGFCPRFGLIHVDLANPNKPRTAGAGAAVYEEIITAGTVHPELFARYPEYPPAGLYCPRTGI